MAGGVICRDSHKPCSAAHRLISMSCKSVILETQLSNNDVFVYSFKFLPLTSFSKTLKMESRSRREEEENRKNI